MAWTDPAAHVWTTGEQVSAANMNTYLKDNLLALREPPRCIMYLGTSQLIGSGTVDVKVLIDTVEIDSDSFADTTNKRIVVPAGLGGLYWIGGGVRYDANATGIRHARVMVNGALRVGTGLGPQSSGTTAYAVTGRPVVLAAGDILELNAIQNSGASLNAAAGANTTWLAIARV
jgi:hypothetical protein